MPIVVKHGEGLSQLFNVGDLAKVRKPEDLHRILTEKGFVELNVGERLTFDLGSDRQISVGHTGGKHEQLVTTEAWSLKAGEVVRITPEIEATVIGEPDGKKRLLISLSDSVETMLGKIDELLQKVTHIDGEEERFAHYRQFVQNRVAELSSGIKPYNIHIRRPVYHGFIHPEAEVSRNIMDMMDFKVNDNEAYCVLMDSIRALKNHSDFQDRSLREIVPRAINHAIGTYFGNFFAATKTGIDSEKFYSGFEPPISLAEFRGKNVALCLEKAALAQNLYSFLGYDTTIIFSDRCVIQLGHQQDSDAHAFNIISNLRPGENMDVLYDPSNPSLIYENGKVRNSSASCIPAIYKLTKEEGERIKSGGQVEVKHNNFEIKEGSLIPKETVTRVYVGPEIRGRPKLT